MTIKFSVDEKKRIIPLIQRYFEEERGEEIGNLAAEVLLDFFFRLRSGHLFNRAIILSALGFGDNGVEASAGNSA